MKEKIKKTLAFLHEHSLKIGLTMSITFTVLSVLFLVCGWVKLSAWSVLMTMPVGMSFILASEIKEAPVLKGATKE